MKEVESWYLHLKKHRYVKQKCPEILNQKLLLLLTYVRNNRRFNLKWNFVRLDQDLKRSPKSKSNTFLTILVHNILLCTYTCMLNMELCQRAILRISVDRFQLHILCQIQDFRFTISTIDCITPPAI